MNVPPHLCVFSAYRAAKYDLKKYLAAISNQIIDSDIHNNDDNDRHTEKRNLKEKCQRRGYALPKYRLYATHKYWRSLGCDHESSSWSYQRDRPLVKLTYIKLLRHAYRSPLHRSWQYWPLYLQVQLVLTRLNGREWREVKYVAQEQSAPPRFELVAF